MPPPPQTLPSIPGESSTTVAIAAVPPNNAKSKQHQQQKAPDLVHFRHPFTGDTTLHMAVSEQSVQPQQQQPPSDEEAAKQESEAAGQRRQLLEFLVARGAGLGERNAEGRTAMHLAAASGCVEALLCLAAHGAHVDAVDARAFTPLHVASAGGHTAAVALLLDTLGADRSRTTVTGLTALQLTTSGRVRRLFFEPAATTTASGDTLRVAPVKPSPLSFTSGLLYHCYLDHPP